VSAERDELRDLAGRSEELLDGGFGRSA